MASIRTRLVRAGLARWGRAVRGVTLGVRILVIDDGKALLVRHGYLPGWHLPGGAVELGETAATAAVRELREETGVQATGEGRLVGLFFNPAFGGRDHVALFRFDSFARGTPPPPNREIAEIGWFPLDGMPAEATGATLRRLAELKGEAVADGRW